MDWRRRAVLAANQEKRRPAIISRALQLARGRPAAGAARRGDALPDTQEQIARSQQGELECLHPFGSMARFAPSFGWERPEAWLTSRSPTASFLAVRTDAAGWLGGGIVLAGLAFHFWSSVTLGRGERPGVAASTPVTDGPFQYVRNPIYLAGITLLLGVRSSRARSSPRRFFPSPTACIAEAHCKSSCRQGPGRSCLAFDSAPQTS